MVVELDDDDVLKDEDTPFKDKLMAYILSIGYYGNIIMLLLILTIFLRKYLEYLGVIPCSMPDNKDGSNACVNNKSMQNLRYFLSHFFKILVVCISLVIALIPEAISLSVIICLASYTK